MISASRHQCLLYEGAPSRQLPAVAAVIQQKLKQNFRCLYLNSQPMVAGLKSYLAAKGVDVAQETAKGALVFSSEQSHLRGDWQFDVDQMIQSLATSLQQALNDGYAGLWAIGDMAWEFGPERDFSKLVEYEQRLEEFLRDHPQIGGVCQYHSENLPRHVLQMALLTHTSLFINETLSLINPQYIRPESLEPTVRRPELDGIIDGLLEQQAFG